MSSLVRPRSGRLIAGVCLGLARRFDVDPQPVRILTALGFLFFGLSFWVYLWLWILMPAER